MRTFVMGDIHGNVKALNQCLDKVDFDIDKDRLIQLGDVVDGIPYTKDCVDILLTIKNLMPIKGNHDEWFNSHCKYGILDLDWLNQGGYNTMNSYADGDFDSKESVFIPDEHRKFFQYQVKYFVDDNKNLFVHGGYNRHTPIEEQSDRVLCWDRDMWMSALSYKEMPSMYEKKPFRLHGGFNKVFIGHTTTLNWKTDKPMIAGSGNVVNIDTGAGFMGRLTIMNVDTMEYEQSDTVEELYGEIFR